MNVTLVGRLIEVVLLGWFAVVAATVLVQIVRGRIITAGMFDAKTDPADAQGLNLDRHQMLIASVGVAVFYVVRALHLQPGAAMPDVPMSVVYAMAGSQAVYLGGKIARSKGRSGGGR